MNDEAAGIEARIALVERQIARHSAELKEADAEHWRHLREHELYDALGAATNSKLGSHLIEGKN